MLVEWLLALAVAGLSFALLPRFLRAARRASGRAQAARKGGGSGVVVAIGMVLAMIYDPRSKPATELIQRKQEIGDEEAGENGETYP